MIPCYNKYGAYICSAETPKEAEEIISIANINATSAVCATWLKAKTSRPNLSFAEFEQEYKQNIEFGKNLRKILENRRNEKRQANDDLKDTNIVIPSAESAYTQISDMLRSDILKIAHLKGSQIAKYDEQYLILLISLYIENLLARAGKEFLPQLKILQSHEIDYNSIIEDCCKYIEDNHIYHIGSLFSWGGRSAILA